MAPSGYSRWLLVNELLVALLAGALLVPFGWVLVAVWWLWLRAGLSRYERLLAERPETAVGLYGRSLVGARWACDLAPLAVGIAAFGWGVAPGAGFPVLALLPMLAAWLGLVWANGRATALTEERGDLPAGAGRRLVGAASLLMVAPLLFTGLVRGLAEALVGAGILVDASVALSGVARVQITGHMVFGLAAVALLAVGPRAAVGWRVVLSFGGLLYALPGLGVFAFELGWWEALTGVLGAGLVNVLASVWWVASITMVAVPLAPLLVAWIAAYQAGRWSASLPTGGRG